MWKACQTAVIAAMIVLPQAAQAYTVKGHIECPDVIKEDSNENYRMANKWWILGYVTARNYKEEREVGRNLDDDAIYAIALDYCRRNQASDWDDAAIHLYNTLGN